MAYESYKDSNGVTWTVITTANGFTMIASVMDSADPKYDPPAEDFTASMPQGGVQLGPLDIVHTAAPTPEQTRTLYMELRGKIDEYAKSHRGAQHVTLKVEEHANSLAWLALGIVILIASEVLD